jgi:SAM-dependent methyltransferase
MRAQSDEAGDWRGLDSPSQASRYLAIVDILRHLEGGAADVLDVGCGEAVLLSYLPKDVSYTGLESSLPAVAIAKARSAHAKIVHTRAEEFDPDDQLFDCVIFNEMLYYTGDPVGLLCKYSAMLREKGAILCSIFQKPEKISWKRRGLTLIDRRRPQSNLDCEAKVRAFMTRHEWAILDDRVVAMPGNSSMSWHIWMATVPHNRTLSLKHLDAQVFPCPLL